MRAPSSAGWGERRLQRSIAARPSHGNALRLRVTLLGTGGSGGVPLLGGADERGAWGACDPHESRNRRTRTAAVVEGAEGRRLLIDAGPDLRSQLLAAGIARLDAVVFTHAHADHVLGIDDLRGVNRVTGVALPAFATEDTARELRARFSYAFREATPPLFYRPALDVRPIGFDDAFVAAGMSIRSFLQDHGRVATLGLRIGRFAYSTDVVRLDEAAIAALAGLDTWVVGCFQPTPHAVHADVAQVLDWVSRLRPRRTVLTHMGPDLDYAALCAALPDGVEPGFDGMVLEVGG